MPVERVRGQRPEDPAWRADALAGSRHSRLLDELREPLEDHDPERARALCADVARLALLDFAPALVLLPPAERLRAQALAAWALTLFDFAAQTGLEGERLSQINRWEFATEMALEGDPPGQPVFVRLAEEHRRRPWPRQSLDGVLAAARRRAAGGAPATPEEARWDGERLAAALAGALLETAPAEVATLGGALLRVRALQELGDGLRRRRPGAVARDLADPRLEADASDRLAAAVADEVERLRPLLAARPARGVPAGPWRWPLAYLRRAGLGLLDAIEASGEALRERPPRLGALRRIGLLLRARWLG